MILSRSLGARRRRALLSVVCAGALVLAACGGDDEPSTPSTAAPSQTTAANGDTGGDDGDDAAWEALIEAAQAEGSVTMLMPGTPAVNDALSAAFAEEYGIDATIIGGAAGELQPRFDEERSSESGDVDLFFSANPAYMTEVVDSGAFVPVQSPNLENEAFTDFPDLVTGDGTAVLVVANPPYIIWNTTLVTEPIESYDDLVARADEFNQSVAAPDLYADFVVAFYTDIEAGSEDGWLEDFLALDPTFFTGSNPLVQSVAAGEVSAGIGAYSTVYNAVIETGAPIEGTVDTDAPNTVNLIGGITSWAPHPNAAQLFMDFLLSEEGQEIIAAGSFSIYPDIEGAIGGPDAIKFDDPSLREEDYLAEYRARFDAARV